MGEKPIIFNAEMVKAILERRKTQTRRPVKPHKPSNDPWKFSPFGKPADVLWVRETVRLCEFGTCIPMRDEDNYNYVKVSYNRTNEEKLRVPCSEWEKWRKYAFKRSDDLDKKAVFVPSIHMPRWACRTTLKVKRVWVERVQDISDEDAIAEGVPKCDTPQKQFKILWNSIYGTWDENPWVWACEFKVIQG